MTPALAKAGKLYSQIGNDFTVVRNLAASFRNASGLLEFAAPNVPRIEYPVGGGCPYLLREAEAENLIQYFNDFSNAYWTKSAILTSNTDVSPDGTTNASTFNDNTNNFMDVRRSITTIDANEDYVLSVYIKKTVGALTHYAGAGVSLGGGFATAYIILNTTNGSFNLADVGGGTFSGYVEEFNDDYWRIELVMNSIYTSALLLLYPALSTNGTTLNSNAQGTNVFYGAQFEKASRATSLIATVGGAATRPADIITATDEAGATTNTFVFEDGSTVEEAATGTITIPVGKLTYAKQD